MNWSGSGSAPKCVKGIIAADRNDAGIAKNLSERRDRAQEFAGFSNTANVDTVAVSTLLAVFNWTPLHGRYADVTNFMARFS